MRSNLNDSLRLFVSNPVDLPLDEDEKAKYLIAFNIDAEEGDSQRITFAEYRIMPAGLQGLFRDAEGKWLAEAISADLRDAVVKVNIELEGGQSLQCSLDLEKERTGLFVSMKRETVDPECGKGNEVDPIEKRAQDLADNIRQDMDLLKDYEDALRRADDPRKRLNCRWNIDELRKSVERNQQEYNALTKETMGVPLDKLSPIGDELGRMYTKLDELSEGQEDIRDDIRQLGSEIISSFEANEQAIITTLLDRLEQGDLVTVSAVLTGIDTVGPAFDHIAETFRSVRETLIEVRDKKDNRHGVTLAGAAKEVLDIVEAPGLDVKHKLKVTVPIIPLLLKYEGEVALKSGVNLENAWGWLKKKIGG